MVTTTDAAPDPAAVQPPETPLEPSGTPSETPPVQAPVVDPVELAKQAVAEIPREVKRLLWDNMPDDERQEVAGDWLERSTQSRAAKNESDAELKLAALDVQGEYFQDLTGLKSQVKEGEDGSPLLDKASDLGALLQVKLDDRYIENALRRHPVHRALTPEDEQKLTSARDPNVDRLVRIRNILEVYLNRATEAGQSPAIVRKQVETELGWVEKLTKLGEVFKAGAGTPPSPEAAVGAMNLQAWNSMPSEAREAYKKEHPNWREEVDAATSTYLASRR